MSILSHSFAEHVYRYSLVPYVPFCHQSALLSLDYTVLWPPHLEPLKRIQTYPLDRCSCGHKSVPWFDNRCNIASRGNMCPQGSWDFSLSLHPLLGLCEYPTLGYVRPVLYYQSLVCESTIKRNKIKWRKLYLINS